jgi:hypothetical protein
MMTSCSVLLRMRNVSEKIVKKIEHIFYILQFFPPKIVPFKREEPQMNISYGACALFAGYRYAPKNM